MISNVWYKGQWTTDPRLRPLRSVMPKIVDQDARREEVLEATWRVIIHGGLSAATMRAIAKEAGTSTGLVNHYFADKSEVLAAALQLNQARMIERMTESIVGVEPGLDALRKLVEATLPLDKWAQKNWIVWRGFAARGPG